MSRASSLLQKANHQLRGERIPLKSRDEDELSNYLNQLAQKTGLQTKSINFEDYGDHISISSDSNIVTPNLRGETPPLGGAASRFLKKKTTSAEDDAAGSTQRGAVTATESPRGPTRSYRPASSVQITSPAKSTTGTAKSTMGMAKSTQQQKTSALDKAKALSNKIAQRSAVVGKRGGVMETDTDESVSLGLYMHGSAEQVKSVASDKSIGRDGNRFLKSSRPAEKAQEVSGNVFMQKIEATRPSTPSKGQRRPERDASMSGTTNAVPEYAAKGQIKYTGNIQLTSEEESMADFINRLSSQDDAKKKALRRAERYKNLQERQSPDIFKRTPSPPSRTPKTTPSPIHRRQLSRSPSQDSDNVDSIRSEIIDTQGSESSGNIFNVVMDLDMLEALPLSPEPAVKKKKSTAKKSKPKRSKSKTKSQKAATSVFKASRKDDIFKAKSSVKTSNKPDTTDGFFGNFGLHTVDELLGGGSDVKEDSQLSESSEIVTERSDIFAAKRRRDSVSSIATDIGADTAAVPQNYSDDFDTESITERIGQGSVQGSKQVRWSVRSGDDEIRTEEVRTEYSDEATQRDYDDDFDSDSYSRSRSYASDTCTETDGYTSDTDTITRSYSNVRRSPSPKQPTSKPKTKSVEIQTGTDPGLGYTWNMTSTGLAVTGPSLGLGFVDPTPIATHVVGADALEAMTSYSPSMLALQDLLKQQMILTQNFLATQKRIYEASMAGLESNYKYTTLKDTKEYIRKHRKPRLTFKKALKMVTKEMER